MIIWYEIELKMKNDMNVNDMNVNMEIEMKCTKNEVKYNWDINETIDVEIWIEDMKLT